MPERETNYWHNKLLELGEKVVSDEIVATTHFYNFGCGCVRTYSVNMLSLVASEGLEPTAKNTRDC